MKNHIYETYLDLGVLGEQKVEVFYDWFKGCTTFNRDEPPSPSYAEVTGVCLFIDGKEIEVSDLLNKDLLADLAYECGESYNG